MVKICTIMSIVWSRYLSSQPIRSANARPALQMWLAPRLGWVAVFISYFGAGTLGDSSGNGIAVHGS